MTETLISLFQEYLAGWSWEDWQSAGSVDKEEIVVAALADIGLEMDVDEAYDLFYEWAAGLTSEDFSTSNVETLSEWISKDLSKPVTSSSVKTWEVVYYEGGVKKSFTVQASSRSEAENIAWSKVDADSLYVTELD